MLSFVINCILDEALIYQASALALASSLVPASLGLQTHSGQNITHSQFLTRKITILVLLKRKQNQDNIDQ